MKALGFVVGILIVLMLVAMQLVGGASVTEHAEAK